VETLVLPGCYDFDGGESVIPPDPACDFSILPHSEPGMVEIYPIGGAQLAYGGVFADAPEPAQCSASTAFSAERESVAPLAAMYVCYRTGEGRLGYLHFTAADLEQAGTVTFEWETFAGAGDAAGNPPGEDPLMYRNETFGFQFPLPATWNGFEVTEQSHSAGAAPDVGTVCFTFVGSTPICVLQVDVWSTAGWNSLERVPDDYYLAENEEFVFASGPYGPECVQLDQFQCERYREIPAILAGFRVEQ
jgi:hypothetical protein